MKVSALNIYPIKSCKGVSLDSSEILPTGLAYDRHWALFDEKGAAITARDYPKMFQFEVEISGESVNVSYGDNKTEFILSDTQDEPENAKIFSENASAFQINGELNEWFSNLLETPCKLLKMNANKMRPVLEEYGGHSGDIFYFADECPILLTTTATLDDLNNRVGREMEVERFRPNIVVDGDISPLVENDWKYLKIGSCEFEVAQLCKRCVMTTIDPRSGEKDSDQEPLRTLAKYNKHPKGGVAFGIHLIPRITGEINLQDTVIDMSEVI